MPGRPIQHLHKTEKPCSTRIWVILLHHTWALGGITKSRSRQVETTWSGFARVAIGPSAGCFHPHQAHEPLMPVPPGTFVIWDGMGLVAKRVEHVPQSDPPNVVLKSLNPEYASYERPPSRSASSATPSRVPDDCRGCRSALRPLPPSASTARRASCRDLLPKGWRYIGGPIPDASGEDVKSRPEWIMEYAECGSGSRAGRPDQLVTLGHRW